MRHWREQSAAAFQNRPCCPAPGEALLQQQDLERLQQLLSSIAFGWSGMNAAACHAKNNPRSDAPTPRFSQAAGIPLVQVIAECLGFSIERPAPCVNEPPARRRLGREGRADGRRARRNPAQTATEPPVYQERRTESCNSREAFDWPRVSRIPELPPMGVFG